MRKIIIYTTIFVLVGLTGKGQDPNFGQFFSSPMNMNPALAGNINSDWRVISNFRNQWIGPANPYVTGTISYDKKIFQNKIMNIEEGNRWGMGLMMMYDQAMAGVAKNSYASLNFSYNMKLTEGDVVNRLGMGAGAIYGRKYIDFGKLTFEEQFTGQGFDVNLPTGEEALANMKGYVSLSGGLVYSRTTEKSNIDFGYSIFHVNEPKQTFLKDPNQVIPMRKVAHANLEMYINDYLILNTNATYQRQSTASYYSAGASLGYQLSSMPDVIINGGLWYWSKNCITPYFGYQRNNFQIGLSYDATISRLRNAPRQPNSFELSIILRGTKPASRVIPCPWK